MVSDRIDPFTFPATHCPFCDNLNEGCTCHEYHAQLNRELAEAAAAWREWETRNAAQRTRTQRAQAETFSFTGLSNFYGESYSRNPVGAPMVRVVSGSGSVYTVSEFDCTCPDHEHTCRPLGIRCKHREAARLQNVFAPAHADRPTADQEQALRMERRATVARWADELGVGASVVG